MTWLSIVARFARASWMHCFQPCGCLFGVFLDAYVSWTYYSRISGWYRTFLVFSFLLSYTICLNKHSRTNQRCVESNAMVLRSWLLVTLRTCKRVYHGAYFTYTVTLYHIALFTRLPYKIYTHATNEIYSRGSGATWFIRGITRSISCLANFVIRNKRSGRRCIYISILRVTTTKNG